MTDLRGLDEALAGSPAREWLDDALRSAAQQPAGLAASFAAAARRVGRQTLAGAPGWNAAEAARALMLAAVPSPELASVAEDLYRHGDVDEKRLILKALPLLPAAGDMQPILHDALRSNDHRLITAALGPCGRLLDQPAWRQAVLKCVFLGIPVTAVDGITDRADAELARMLMAFADERTAAGRAVPADAAALLRSLPIGET